MQKVLSVLLALAIMTALSACAGAESQPAAVVPTESTEAVQLPETEEMLPDVISITDDSTIYADVLTGYADALNADWAPEKYMEAGMNYLPGLIRDPEKVGYYLADLDGVGFPELLIGEVGKNEIFVMYTMIDDSPVTVIRANERNTYQLTADGGFYNRGANGAAFTGHLFYTFVNGGLRYQDALMYNTDADSENPWFYTTDEDWDVSNDLPYGSGDAENYIRMVEESIVEIPYIPFSEYVS